MVGNNETPNQTTAKHPVTQQPITRSDRKNLKFIIKILVFNVVSIENQSYSVVKIIHVFCSTVLNETS